MLKFKVYFSIIRYFILIVVFRASKNKNLIIADIERWSEHTQYSQNIYIQFVYLLRFFHPFRNLF